MGDLNTLKDQLELGIPVEESMLLSGFSFEEIENHQDNSEVVALIKMSKAIFMRKHLTQLSVVSDERPQVSQWLLERLHPDKFGSGSKNQEAPFSFPGRIILEGVHPDSNADKK